MDRVIWTACLGLFLAGGIFSQAAFGSNTDKPFTLIDCFSILSAVATAIAAYAAWRAASAAQRQSFDTAASGRRQSYRTHVESFNEWLDGIEADQGVEFYRRHELYESMFPKNRNPSLEFTEVGDPEIAAWANSFKALADMACDPTTPEWRFVERWVGDFASLCGYMKLKVLDPARDQVRLGGIVTSGVCRENFERVLPVMGMVLTSLSDFAFVKGATRDRGMSQQFKDGFVDFLDAVQINGWNQHQYG